MQPTRLLVALVAGAMVAVPGLAIAQSSSPSDVPPGDVPPVEVPAGPKDSARGAQDDAGSDQVGSDDVEAQDDVESQGDGGGHGEVISTLATCLPSGAELHGTGLTKGRVMSQAASTGDVDGNPVTTPEEAIALCGIVQGLADGADAPAKAKGRPDWAGPKDGVAGAGQGHRGAARGRG